MWHIMGRRVGVCACAAGLLRNEACLIPESGQEELWVSCFRVEMQSSGISIEARLDSNHLGLTYYLLIVLLIRASRSR